MNTDSHIWNKLYRAGLTAGGILFGLAFLEPILAVAAPFLPLIVTIFAGLFAGLLVKAIFNSLVNKKLNQSYRYSAKGSTAAGASRSSGQQTRKTKQRAGQEPPRQEPPPPPPDSMLMYRKILGLGARYTVDELKAAYRDCAEKFHPDRYANASENERRRAEEMMKNINEAYHALL